MPITAQPFVEAYRAGSLAQAYAIRLALDEAGIPVVLENTNLQDAVGEIPSGWATAPRLLVEESRLAEAREIIEQLDRGTAAGFELTTGEVAGLVPFGMFAAPLAIGGYIAGDRNQLPDTAEVTKCLSCGALMAESEAVCSHCGWTYQSADDVVADNEDIE